jgi:hypothetical protein
MPGDVLKSERIERWQRAKVKCLDYKRWLSSDIIGNLSYFPRKEGSEAAQRPESGFGR